MLVLYLLNNDQIGGANRAMLTLWQGLSQTEFEPFAILPRRGPMSEACDAAGVQHMAASFQQPSIGEWASTLRGYSEWIDLIRSSGADLVHSNGLHASRSIAVAARRHRLPHLCHVHFPAPEPYCHWVFRGLPSPNTFLYPSSAIRQQMENFLSPGSPRATHCVNHNATDTQQFHPQTKTTPHRPRVGIIANLQPVKGHEHFLQMASKLTQRGLDAEYWVIGGDVHGDGREDVLRELASRLGLSGRVFFWGARDDVPKLARQLDMLVCPSLEEPFGICLIEAMSSGVPTVATDVGGIPEVVEDGVTGFLVAPGDAEALAKHAGFLLEDESARRKMGRAGRDRVLAMFSAELHAKRTEALYHRLLG